MAPDQKSLPMTKKSYDHLRKLPSNPLSVRPTCTLWPTIIVQPVVGLGGKHSYKLLMVSPIFGRMIVLMSPGIVRTSASISDIRATIVRLSKTIMQLLGEWWVTDGDVRARVFIRPLKTWRIWGINTGLLDENMFSCVEVLTEQHQKWLIPFHHLHLFHQECSYQLHLHLFHQDNCRCWACYYSNRKMMMLP